MLNNLHLAKNRPNTYVQHTRISLANYPLHVVDPAKSSRFRVWSALHSFAKACRLLYTLQKLWRLQPLTKASSCPILRPARFGGALVSTKWMRQRRHAEDDPLASLKIGSKIKC